MLPLSLILTLPLLAPQGQQALEPALQARVNRAIDRGVESLLSQQELDGSWRAHMDSYPSGMTALAAYALVKSGVPRDHLAVRRAFSFLRTHPPHKTYSTACQILAFVSLGEPGDRERVDQLAEQLLSWHNSGGFGYPEGRMDLSNTQYAALALRAAAAEGFEVSTSFWDLLSDRVIELQESFADDLEPAGFGYQDAGSVTASMTAAGVGVLAICKEQGITHRRLEQALGVGLGWMAREFAVHENRPVGEDNLYYYLYGLERVGSILGLQRLGSHEWYAEGAAFLVDRQDPSGAWGWQAQTAFALLFLTKATAPITGERAVRLEPDQPPVPPGADVVLRSKGSSPVTFWIDSFGPGASDLEWDGEGGLGPRVIRVEYRSRERGESRLLATVHGEPREPARSERFPVQVRFERPGIYAVHAAVHVLQPGFEQGDPLGEHVLHSPSVRVRVVQAWNPELVGYARDPLRNLLAGVEVEARASSSRDDRSGPERAVDGLQASAWRAAPGDPAPTLTLELGDSVRADTLLLSHAFRPWDGDRSPRIGRVAVRINKARKPLEVELVDDDWRKTVVPLGRAARIRTIEVRVLDGDEGGGYGFGEIELQRREGR